MKAPRKIDDDELLIKMHEEGKSLKEIGVYFGCTPVAVHKRLKKLLPGPADAILEESGLTDQQKKFCLEKAQGATNTQAALASYEVTTGDSAKSIGCELMANETIRQTIDRLMQVHGLTRSYRIGKLKTHVDNRDPDVSLKALDMSFKLDDSYPNKHVDLNVSVDMDEAQVKARLKYLLGKMSPEQLAELTGRTTIDVTPEINHPGEE